MQILQNIFNALAGITASFFIFLGSVILGFAPQKTPDIPLPAEQIATDSTSSPQATTATFPQATIKAAVKPPGQKSGLPASGVLAETGDPRTFAQEVLPKQTATPTTPTKSQEQINEEVRAALVNILCLPHVGINGISGSGVIIDSRGVILTNAHIAQYFLLRDYLTPGNITCTVRVGSPAQERYTATLLYVSPAWVADNAAQLKAAQATGTGENDYAFLLIIGRTDPLAALSQSFEYLEMDRGYPDIGDQMLLAAYPAGFLGGDLVQKSLYMSSAIAYVTQLFSFGDAKRVDLFSIGGTVVSQGGSSGGAAVRLTDGKLAGIITTATVGVSTGERDLRAVSLAYIDDSLAAQGQGGIMQLLSGDLSAKAAYFASTTAISERAMLLKVLGGN